MSAQVKKTLKTYLGRAAAFSGALGYGVRSKMTIVAFHRISNSLPADGITCTADKFEMFCSFFRRHFDVVPLAGQVAAYRSGKSMGGTLSITFDDGYRDNFDLAAPVLKSFGMPATFFVATGFIGTSIVPEWDKHLPAHPGWMSWDQVRGLAAQGFDIGCHTHTHIDMGSCDAETVSAELEKSKHKLELELGKPVRLFAYPFGGREHICERSLQLVREHGFECCASCCGGTNASRADPYSLNRIGIADWFATPDQFGLELLFNRV
jgi:peptidoglycan/xylan/chitin deacetylase (PgdA/CDA1 family)